MTGKLAILEYMRAGLRAGHEIIPAGIVEREVGTRTGQKGSTLDRRMRELENDGWILKVEMDYGGKKFKGYKLAQK